MTTRGIVAIWLVAVLLCAGLAQEAQEPKQPAPPTQPAEEKPRAEPKEEPPEPIVVTATRLDTPRDQVGSSTTVITRKQIEQTKRPTVIALLREVPGLDVVQAGGAGQQASVFIRGTKSEHTLVLIDGVEANDPISPGRSFDWAHLSTDNVERIEIIRGPQSTLYGSDAIGGVINIITRKGAGKPSGYFTFEAGSRRTFRESAGVSGSTPVFNYAVALSRLDTEGISAASRRDGNIERDGYTNTTFSARLGFSPAENFDINVFFRCAKGEAELDNAGGPGADDVNYTSEAHHVSLRTEGRLVLLDGLWEQKFGVSCTRIERSTHNDPDFAHPFDLERSSYDGQVLKLDWQHNLHLHETNTLTVGFEAEQERGKSYYHSESMWGPYDSVLPWRSARMNSVYVQDYIALWDRWYTTVGCRLDDHSEFGSKLTYRVTSIYHIRETGTRIKGTVGTGFKAPTLYQLYAGKYGNAALLPEESKGCDFGVEQDLLDGALTLGATCFHNRVKNLIEYDFITWQYYNTDLDARGVELTATARPARNLTIIASCTRTRSEDTLTGEPFVRRPKHKAALNVNYQPIDKLNVNLGATYVGRREDFYFDNVTWATYRVPLDPYLLVNLAVSYDITKNLQVFGRLENILDERYEEVKGYGTPGFGLFTGVTARF